MQRIIKSGEWKYSGNTYLPIVLVEEDWENFQSKNQSRFSSHINKKDLVYFLHFSENYIDEQGNISSHSSSKPFFSIKEAMDFVERNIEKLNWKID